MSRVGFRVDALPTDVFKLLASFLTGIGLLRFSHVNQGITKTAKERYFAARSVVFSGRGLPQKLANERGSAVELWNQGMPQYWLEDSLSLDLWFALLPGDNDPRMGIHFGGIILGAQSSAWANNCTKTVVAKDLRPQRWYYLTLTLDQTTVYPTQRVYLNGELVHTTTGRLHSEASELYSGQLGSGCISGGALGKPTEDFCGWYGFHGVIDACRLWRGVLQPDHVRRAAQSKLPGYVGDGEPFVSQDFHAGNMKVLGTAWLVQCTRPVERFYAKQRHT